MGWFPYDRGHCHERVELAQQHERKHKFKHTNNDRKQITYLLRRRLLGNYCIQKLIQVLETNNASFTEFKAFT